MESNNGEAKIQKVKNGFRVDISYRHGAHWGLVSFFIITAIRDRK